MNPVKEIIIKGLLERINASPYLIVIDYTGLTVTQFTELRNRLGAGGAQCTVAKNSYMRKVLAEAGMPDLGDVLAGQTAFVMGESEIFAAAKAIKNFEKEFKKPEMKAGILGDTLLDSAKLQSIAEIPSREAILASLLGTILEPGAQIARVIQAKFNPDGDTAPSEKSEPAAEPAAEAPAEAAAEAPAEPAAEAPAEPAAE